MVKYTMVEVKRYCKQCGKELVKKKIKCKNKRGWKWEAPSDLSKHIFCNHSCGTTYINLISDRYLHWTKEMLLKKFNKIKTDKKWKCGYIKKNYPALSGAIEKHFKKHWWAKFVTEQDKLPILNNLNPEYKIHAKLLLKYWREEEITNGIGKKFIYSSIYGIPGITENSLKIVKVLNYLKKLNIIRVSKKGNSGGYYGSYPTEYVLLKSRI